MESENSADSARGGELPTSLSKEMRTMVWKLALVTTILGSAVLLGVQAAIAASVAVLIVGFGPARLKSLRRLDREDAALHMGAALTGAAGGFVFAVVSTLAAGFIRDFSLLASWVCLYGVAAVSVFHFSSYPVRLKAAKKPEQKAADAPVDALPLAG